MNFAPVNQAPPVKVTAVNTALPVKVAALNVAPVLAPVRLLDDLSAEIEHSLQIETMLYLERCAAEQAACGEASGS